jgi:glycosyltransferase involved in cell wall biosynthesis
MEQRKEVLLLIPAYNEVGSIGALLEKLQQPQIREIADILVVNDASDDMTNWLVKTYHVTMISQVFNMGYGSALQTGYKYAVRRNYKYVIQLDADGQHDVCNILTIYEKLTHPDEDGRYPNIVIGSRFADGSQSFKISGVKKISISFFRWMIRRITGQKIMDPTSGLQGLNREAFLYYSMYRHFDVAYPDANMIIQMLMLGYKVVEVPSVMHPRVSGVSMHSGIIKPMLYMLTMPLSILSIFARVRENKQKKITMLSHEE